MSQSSQASHFKRQLVSVLLLCLTCSANVIAAQIEWKNAVDGNWSDAANWTGGAVPGINDDVCISTGGTYAVFMDQDVTIRSLKVGGTTGSQCLLITSQTLSLSLKSTIASLGKIELNAATLSGNGALENRGNLLLRSATVTQDLFNFSTLQVRNDAAPATVVNGEIVNATAASLDILGGTAFDTKLKVHQAQNFGKITLGSSGGKNALLQYFGGAGQLFVNATSATICTVTGAGGLRCIEGGVDSRFRNFGHIEICTTSKIRYDGEFENKGLIECSKSSVTIESLRPINTFGNAGDIRVKDSSEINFDNGHFEPRSGGRLLGLGKLNFQDITVRNGEFLLNDPSACFAGLTRFENSCSINNSGRMQFRGSCTLDAAIVNQKDALMHFRTVAGTPAAFAFTGDIENFGDMQWGSDDQSDSASSTSSYNNVHFENSGKLILCGPDNSAASTRTFIMTNDCIFENTGTVDCCRQTIFNCFAFDSRFNSEDGMLMSSGAGSQTTILSSLQFMPASKTITLGDMQIAADASIAVVQTTPGALVEVPSPTTECHNLGQLFLQNCALNVKPEGYFLDDGEVLISSCTIESAIEFRECNSRLHNIFTRPGADLTFGGPDNTISGTNCLEAEFKILAESNMTMGPDNNGLGSFTQFKAGGLNLGCIQVDAPGKKTIVEILDGLFVNQGKFATKLASDLELIIKESGKFKNDSTGKIDFGSAGGSSTTVNMCDNALFQNLGALETHRVAASDTLPKFALKDSAFIFNTGEMVIVPPFSDDIAIVQDVYVDILLMNISNLLNIGRLEFIAQSNALLKDKYQTGRKTSLKLLDHAKFTNFGDVTIEVPLASDSVKVNFGPTLSLIDLRDNACLRNTGNIEVKPQEPPSDSLIDTYVMMIEPETNIIGLEDESVFANEGTVNMDLLTIPTAVRLDFTASFSNSDEVRIQRLLHNEPTVVLKDGTTFNNSGDFFVEEFTSELDFLVPFGARALTPSAAVSIFDSAAFNNSGLTRLTVRRDSLPVIMMRDSARWRGPGSLEIFDSEDEDAPAGLWDESPAILMQDATELTVEKGGAVFYHGFADLILAGPSLTQTKCEVNFLGLLNCNVPAGEVLRSKFLDSCGLKINELVVRGGGRKEFDIAPGAALTYLETSQIDVDKSVIDVKGVDEVELSKSAFLRGEGRHKLADRLVNRGGCGPGRSPGILTIGGDYTHGTTSTLELEIGGTSAGLGYDQLVVNGEFTLGGNLNISSTNNFVPADADEFVIMRYESVTGAFSTVAGLLNIGYSYTLQFNATEAILTASVANAIVFNIDVFFQGYWTGSAHRRTPFMLELREGPQLSTSALVARSAALHSTGATTQFNMAGVTDGDYWLIVRHGGHLPLASNVRVSVSSGSTVNYDFSDTANLTGGAAYVRPVIVNGVARQAAMAGELNADNSISANDFIHQFIPNFGVFNPGQVPALD